MKPGSTIFLARYYSSTQERFTSPDEFSGGPDKLYDFADDASENPTFYSDRTNRNRLISINIPTTTLPISLMMMPLATLVCRSGQSWDDIDFCIYLQANGTVDINEGSISRGNFGTYAAGDVFRVAGDGYMEFTATEANTHRRAGLSNGNANQNWDDIDFCIYLQANGTVDINEGSTSRGNFGTYAAGDVFRVAVEGGVVKYRRNGALLYTSTIAPTYPLLVDTSLYTNGATLTNVTLTLGGLYNVSNTAMTTNQNMTYEAVEDQQRALCKELNQPYVPADAESKVGFALKTQGCLPINGLRHPPQGDTNGWYLWCGEELPLHEDSFSPLHTHHLIQDRPEVLKFLGLPPGSRFLVAGDYVDVWFDPSLLDV